MDTRGKSSVLTELIADIALFQLYSGTKVRSSESDILGAIGPGESRQFIAVKMNIVAPDGTISQEAYDPDDDNAKLGELKASITMIVGNEQVMLFPASIEWLVGLINDDLHLKTLPANTQYRKLLVSLPLLWFKDNSGVRFVIASMGGALDIVRGKLPDGDDSTGDRAAAPQLKLSSHVKALAALHYLVLCMYAYVSKNDTEFPKGTTLSQITNVLQKMSVNRLKLAMRTYAETEQTSGNGIEECRLLARAYAKIEKYGEKDAAGHVRGLYEFVFEKAMYPVFRIPPVV
jgi:hypothetical protein